MLTISCVTLHGNKVSILKKQVFKVALLVTAAVDDFYRELQIAIVVNSSVCFYTTGTAAREVFDLKAFHAVVVDEAGQVRC